MKKKINRQKVIGYFVLITLISTAIFLIFVIKDESVLWNLKLAIEYKKIKREEMMHGHECGCGCGHDHSHEHNHEDGCGCGHNHH